VDPDLGPWVLGNPVTHRAHMLAALEEAQRRDPDSRKINANLRDLKKDVAQEQNILAYFNLREKYQWIPSEFLINRKTKDVQIVSRIHDLPAVKKNKKLYVCLLNVFKAMVPMFEKLNLFEQSKDNNKKKRS